jgi:pyruvate dehydrogenase E2 component (dihydrolipoamide acetyltransferase)
MATFSLPKLGADMTEGRLVEWLKKPGERVERGEVIAVIETDKANVEVESWVAGTLERILVDPGDRWMPVGTPLAAIRTDGPEPVAPPAFAPAAPPPVAPSPAAPPPAAAPSAPAAPGERLRASPAARRRAQELGLDLAAIRATGPDGRVTLEDVEQAAAAKPAAPPAADRQQRMREAIAAAMSRAKREIPHYYLSTMIDAGPALAWLEARNRSRPVTERLLHGVLLLKAVALALREVPELNGYWIDGRAVRSETVNVGVAVSLRGGGLVAPALHDADRQPLDELMRQFRDLVNRARAGTLRSSEMTEATITVTSLGERGVEAVFGIIYPPQLGLVGFGKIVERPWVVGGEVVARPVITATLSGDHRATDGHRGGLFLDAVDRLLRTPEKL